MEDIDGEEPSNADRVRALDLALRRANALSYLTTGETLIERVQRIIAHGPRPPLSSRIYDLAREVERHLLRKSSNG
jgi:hypothetical protein